MALWPATLLGVAGLIALIAHARRGSGAALAGWFWGLGHFTLGDNWIATAFTYQAKMPAWLGWAAVVALSLYLALFPALGAWLGWIAARRARAPLVPALAAGWIVSEWLRGWVCTGFAWNPLAMAALGPFSQPGLAALAPWLGTYALSGLVVLLAGCWWAAARRARRDARTLVLLVLPALLLLWPGHIGPPDRVGKLAYTLVQPDFAQPTIDDPRFHAAHFATEAALSTPTAPGERRLVLWPESGTPDLLRPGYPSGWYRIDTYAGDPAAARAQLGAAIGPGSVLLTGTTDLDFRGDDLIGAGNVVTALDAKGEILGGYAKAHLVPYGEYLPMRWLLSPLGLARLVPGDLDFLPGPGPRTLDLGGWGRAGVQICYEIVFSGDVVDRAHRPDYIVNPTNDGWFGSWGPPQHLAQARMRAIEEGLPVLRPTVNGISAAIDADGIVRGFIARKVAGRLDGFVPPAHAPTLFSRLGNALPLAWAGLLFLVALCLSQVASRKRDG